MSALNVRFAALVLMAVALPLAGCETTGDPLGSITTSPGQYDYYDCPAIKVAARDIITRQRELEGLMARANRGPGGGLVNTMTYEPEYVTLRGKMNELRRAAAANKCKFDPAAVQPPAPQPVTHLPPPKKPLKNTKRR